MRTRPDPSGDHARSPGGPRGMRAAAVLTGTVLLVTAACGPNGSPSSQAASESEGGLRTALHTVWAAVEAAQPAPVLATFADDVQLHSPALIGPEYRGRDLVASIVTPAMQILGKARVTDVLQAGDGATGSVVFETRIGNEPAQGVVLLRTTGQQVREITLLLRPLPALRAFVARMAELGAKPALDSGQQ